MTRILPCLIFLYLAVSLCLAANYTVVYRAANSVCSAIWDQRKGPTLRDFTRVYLGCFKDAAKRAISGNHWSTSLMTTEICHINCLSKSTPSKNFTLFGTQMGRHCFCGVADTLYDLYGRVDGDCNKPCSGYPRQMCGGLYRNSVYDMYPERTGYTISQPTANPTASTGPGYTISQPGQPIPTKPPCSIYNPTQRGMCYRRFRSP